MIYVLLISLLLIVIYAPQFWVQAVLSRYNRAAEDNFPGTGAELARCLVNTTHKSRGTG
ncbi:MAG: zinc metallopeptidase [Gammaproteobacteria bacterium]|nr:zinc metallopeptidase [Gammaproteobacteria bacterium]